MGDKPAALRSIGLLVLLVGLVLGPVKNMIDYGRLSN